MACPPGLASCRAAFDYQSGMRDLITKLKYSNCRTSVVFLARTMAALVADHLEEGDLVTWAPTTPQRRRRRGFDQSEVLARAVARLLGLPCRHMLVRRAGPAQSRLPARLRGEGIRFQVSLRGRLVLTSPIKRCFLVDDVVTSGLTASSAARVLAAAGVREVHALAAARARPRGLANSPVRSALVACGSVVESRSQSQAKRPT